MRRSSRRYPESSVSRVVVEARCAATGGFERGPVEAVIVLCRTRYAEALHVLGWAFSAAGASSGFQADNALAHREVYREAVVTALSEGRRVAYLLVDALRHEMAVSLISEGLEENYC